MPRPFFLPVALCLSIFATGAACAASPVLIYGDDDYPPYSYV